MTEDDYFAITDWRNYRNKGESLLGLASNYVVIDIETTGFDPKYNEIIELSAVKVKGDVIIDKFTTLCNPEKDIEPFITKLTGITNDMVKDAPRVKEVIGKYVGFIGNSILLGHNINFDVNFIYDNYYNLFEKPFKNDFVDTLRLARRVCTDLEHHRLSDLLEYYNIVNEQMHRSLSDCIATHKVYLKLKDDIITRNISLEMPFMPSRQKNSSRYGNLKDIKTTVDNFDKTHPFYGKYFVFTGSLQISRGKAAQIVADLGGINESAITKKTNYLVLGNYDYFSVIKMKGDKSTKHKKAEERILQGQDLQILTENTFFDMINANE